MLRTSFSACESPCLRIKDNVSMVPVEGAHVILKGTPTFTTGAVVNVNGFWACARVANMTQESWSVRRSCILLSFYTADSVGWSEMNVVEEIVNDEWKRERKTENQDRK
jgi:uncharacterized protein YdaU (DUF1376 family)